MFQKTYRESEISEELRIESIERVWNKVMSAHQERDQAIHDEIARLGFCIIVLSN